MNTLVCDFLMTMDVMLCTASIFNLCAISVDRYVLLFVTYARFLISSIFSSVNALRIEAVSLNYCLPLRVNNLISTFTAWRCFRSPSLSATTTQNITEAEARRCRTNDETLCVGHLSSEEVIYLLSASSGTLLGPLSEAGRQT